MSILAYVFVSPLFMSQLYILLNHVSVMLGKQGYECDQRSINIRTSTIHTQTHTCLINTFIQYTTGTGSSSLK